MGRENILKLTCDRCGIIWRTDNTNTEDKIHHVCWKHDTFTDAAGSKDYKVGEMELCGECAALILEHVLEQIGYEAASRIMEKRFQDRIRVS